MKIKIKRFDKSLPLPEYKTKGAVCMDAYSRKTTVIPAHEVGYIPLNIAVKLPEGYWLMLAARSSTHKMGLMPANGIGIGDWDFCGDNDEYKFIAYNYTDSAVTIEKGTRVAQLMICKCERAEIEEVASFDQTDRGGIGSTGTQ